MTTKLSSDATKMIDSLENHFNDAFKAGKYSSMFHREFKRLFNPELASDFSFLSSNKVYIHGIGIIDCLDFNKNIELIENKVYNAINELEKHIHFFKKLVPFVEKEKSEGNVEDTFVELFYETLKEVKECKGKDEIEDSLSSLLFKQLK